MEVAHDLDPFDQNVFDFEHNRHTVLYQLRPARVVPDPLEASDPAQAIDEDLLSGPRFYKLVDGPAHSDEKKSLLLG